MKILKEICHCGHDKDTHFEKAEACLGSRCDCPGYRDASKPDTLKQRPKKPQHAYFCKCFYCVRWEEWIKGNAR